MGKGGGFREAFLRTGNRCGRTQELNAAEALRRAAVENNRKVAEQTELVAIIVAALVLRGPVKRGAGA